MDWIDRIPQLFRRCGFPAFPFRGVVPGPSGSRSLRRRRLFAEHLEPRQMLSTAWPPLSEIPAVDASAENGLGSAFESPGRPQRFGNREIDRWGNVVHLDPVPDSWLTTSPADTFSAQAAASPASGPFPLADTFFLHSYPSATKTIYLDFDGHVTSGTNWNTSYNGGSTFVTPAFSLDGDSKFSDLELERIQAIWQRVAEDFRPFEVNVTTQDPGAQALQKSGTGDAAWGIRVVIGGSSTDWFSTQAYGGVAYVGSFDWSTDTPAFVFENNLTNGSEKLVAEAITHESGHTLGLEHDGTTAGVEYYTGHGSGSTGWAPIMGSGYSRELTQWSKGEYPNANNSEDDLSIITTRNGFGYRPDDHGDLLTAATALNPSGGSIPAGQGIIERNTDRDYFSFVTGAGTVALAVKPLERGPNLDIVATLYDRSGLVIATSNPLDRLDASFSVLLTAGTYYLAIEGTGKAPLTTGYSDYGSLGYYSITGTLPSDGLPPYVVDVSPASATVVSTRNVFVDVAFSKPVVNVDASDMVLSGSAAAAAYVSTPSDLGGNRWRFPVHALADGSLQIELALDPDDIEDAAGNDLDPSPTVFTYTVAIRDVIYTADMTADPGWTLSPGSGASRWQWGTPTGGGGGSGNPDPASGYTGTSVIGYNLAGDYANSITATQWARTPAIDASAFRDVQLRFYRWLNIDRRTYDYAIVQVSNDGTGWTTIWQNPTSALTDASWKLQTFDISSVADGRSTVYVRWGLGPTNSRTQYSGWNLDDVEVYGVRTATPGVTVTPTSALTTDEGGGTASFSVVLNAVPLANVTIDLSSSDENEGTVSPASLTFTPANWSTPQTVTVGGVDDPLADGDASYTIVTAPAVSADDGYHGWNPADVSITNVDNDLPVVLAGQHILLPNTPNQTIPILVEGDFSVQGLNFHVQIADGGPEASGSIDGPDIQSVDLAGNAVAPTIFTGNHSGQAGSVSLPQVQAWEISTAQGTVTAGGLLASLTIDTTGFWKDATGTYTWPLHLADTQTGSTHFLSPAGNRIHAVTVSGTLTLNTPPVALASIVTTAEDTTYTFAAADFGFSDADAGDVLTKVRIASLPAAGSLTFEGTSVMLDQEILTADLAAGKLRFLPASDAYGVSYAAFQFKVHDGTGYSNSSAAMTVHVTPENDPPTADDQWISSLEDGGSTLTLTGFDPEGDELEFVILEPPGHGTLTGTAPNLWYAPQADFHGTDSFTFISHDGLLDSDPATVTISVTSVPDVVGRYVFYNDSAWDGDDPAPSPSDDLAIAVDKRALLPGQQAEFVHYTSYDKGLNGLMIDLDDLAAGTVLTAADFQFRVGNSDDPAAWPMAPLPNSLTLRPGAGVGGSTRVTLTWADPEAIRNQWLQVTLQATPNTTLPFEDVFYFGNAIGESGLGNGDGLLPPQTLAYFPVNVTDEIGARNHPHTELDPAARDDAYDFNRDRRVDSADETIARTQGTHFQTALRRIAPSAASPTAALADDEGTDGPQIAVGTHVVQPNTPGQTIPIYVSGGWPVQGLNFNIQVADGGPSAGGMLSAPVITDVDILTATIFAATNTGLRTDANYPGGADPVPQHEYRGTTTAAGTVSAEGLLATVTIDTTGFERGSWSLVMSNTVNGSTDFAGLASTIVDGVIILPRTWSNPDNPLDVDGNGRVAPLDALIVIGYLNAHPDDSMLPTMPHTPPFFYDVNGDNYGTAADVLTVINFLNAHEPTMAGEGEAEAGRMAADEGVVEASLPARETPRNPGTAVAQILANGRRKPTGACEAMTSDADAGLVSDDGQPRNTSQTGPLDDFERILDDLLPELADVP
jgi:hypothetical protein